MEFTDYVRVLLKNWVLLVVGAVLGTVAAGLISYASPRIFSATAQSFIAINNTDSTSGNVLTGAQFTLQRVKSYTQVVTSPDVLQPVIDELGLPMTVEQLAPNVTATSPLDTVLIEVTATDGSAVTAAAIANAVTVQLGRVIEQLEAPSSGGPAPVKASLTNPAEPPSGPSSPRYRLNLVLGLLVGLASAVAAAFLRESLDRTVKGSDELAELAGAAPLGMVAFDPEAKSRPLVALDQRASRAEAIRTIRTNLQYVDVDNAPTVIAVTSAIPGEGKSTMAANLAITFAQAGKRVIVVETDLRRPRVSAYFGVDSSLGLTDVLAGQCDLDDAILSWNRGLLDVLPSGHPPPNPSELLASQQMATVLETLKGSYDIVVVDGTPLLPVTDGAIVAKAADGAILVARFGETTRDQIEAATSALAQVDARLLGTVLNFVPTGRRGYGYGYRYRYGYRYGYRGYGYGYGYGYGGYSSDETPTEDRPALPTA